MESHPSGLHALLGVRMFENRLGFFSVSYYLFSFVFIVDATISFKYKNFLLADKLWPLNKPKVKK